MDGAAFPELHSIVAASDDPRIWVFAEWIGPDFAAKTEDGMWSPYYHALLYNLTDDAVFACPEDTTWLLVTNGDNEYADSFLARAAAEAARGSADVVAFDFYSRYQRPTAPQCDRLATLPAPAPACKRNRLAWCHTDLGAYVLRYARFLRERRGFGAGARAVAAPDLGAEHADGLLAAALAADGWAAAHVTDACLFSHSPSPQACAWGGGVWDDRDMMTWQAGGGACVSRQDLDWIMEHDPGAEVVAVALSSDGDIAGFGSAAGTTAVDAAGQLTIQCIRRRDYLSEEVWGAAMDWYGELCADEMDLPVLRARQQQQQQQVGGEGEPGEEQPQDQEHPEIRSAHQDL
ncbi:hypothetical protein ACKKBG_A20435 [Auxenochlorella protothecoides x Auxenochlorella symbiontica]